MCLDTVQFRNAPNPHVSDIIKKIKNIFIAYESYCQYKFVQPYRKPKLKPRNQYAKLMGDLY